MLKRRHLMAGLAGATLAAPLVARAQGTYPIRSVVAAGRFCRT